MANPIRVQIGDGLEDALWSVGFASVYGLF